MVDHIILDDKGIIESFTGEISEDEALAKFFEISKEGNFEGDLKLAKIIAVIR